MDSLKRLRAHPDNKTKQAMQRDCEQAADEIERLSAAYRHSEAHAMRLMNERDAALNLWPRDCRLCANHTTASGGCTSALRCVDSDKYKPTTPRQLWEAAPLSPAPF